MLQCNVSHWLRVCSKWSLYSGAVYYALYMTNGSCACGLNIPGASCLICTGLDIFFFVQCIPHCVGNIAGSTDTVQGLNNMVNFLRKKIVTIDIPYLACEGKIWGVFCEYKLWFMWSLSQCSALCKYNVILHRIIMTRGCTSNCSWNLLVWWVL